MPLPLVLLGAAALAGAAGGVNAFQGVRKFGSANDKAKRAEQRHDMESALTADAVNALNVRAAAYGEHQARVAVTTVARFIELVRRNGQRASSKDLSGLDGFECDPIEIDEYEGLISHAGSILAGGLKAAGVAAGVHAGVPGLVMLFGTASTGTAISGLSGAALTNATLAWLGGGSIAAGGGGVALGTTVLGAVAAGPAVLVGGLVLNGQGEKAKTKAAAFEAEVHTSIAEQRKHRAFLERVGRRVDELDELLTALDARAFAGIERLENTAPSDSCYAAAFQETAMLVHAVAEILRTPVLVEQDGGQADINEVTGGLLARYRPLTGERDA